MEVVSLFEISGNVHERCNLRYFWKQIGGQIHDFLEQESALAVEL
jgi:hypothetical protein